MKTLIILTAVLLTGCANTSYPPREPCTGKGGVYSGSWAAERVGHSSFECQNGAVEYIIRIN